MFANVGKPVKLNGAIDVTWSHGDVFNPGPHRVGFKCFLLFDHQKRRGYLD